MPATTSARHRIETPTATPVARPAVARPVTVATPARPPAKPPAPVAHTPAVEEDGSKDRQFVTALARGLDILRAFHAGDGMLGNQEIAARAGLPKPTVARLTHTLTELGYLSYARRFRKYELGPSVLALGYAALSNMDVRHVARAPMQALAQQINASVSLGGRDRHSMIWLECHRGPSAVGITYDVGSRVPIASTAMGRAYVAALPEPEKSRLLDSLRRRGRDDWGKIKAGIEQAEREIAERGFCLSWGEWLPEIAGVGAPLRSPDGETFFAFNASAPIYQVSRERLEQDWGPRLVRMAREVRNGLAGRAATPPLSRARG
ncbi:MAG: IclR family transcriptional regulator [Rhodospirillales bacterium]|nr:MAG: IclR family transcriptional regulator [Rhodospirillales bacterium]